MTVIDAWMQHPTVRFARHDMFDSLRRWTGTAIPDNEPGVDQTIAAMDHAGVSKGLVSAWHGPDGWLISNDEVKLMRVLSDEGQRLPATGLACDTVTQSCEYFTPHLGE